ncbi:hypothetical protein DVDV_4213 [Desulfovibrio sp. DV]|nr:hypothetical protein DVDV_4213 [Desulfovibrio sp. DV]
MGETALPVSPVCPPAGAFASTVSEWLPAPPLMWGVRGPQAPGRRNNGGSCQAGTAHCSTDGVFPASLPPPRQRRSPIPFASRWDSKGHCPLAAGGIFLLS